jgi:multidrug resistance protein, MATE family
MGNPRQGVRPDWATGKQLLRVAWPLILSNSFWVLQINLDRIFLSWSSGVAVGAAMTTAVLFWVPLSLLQYTANYATTFVAQYTGAGQPRRVGAAVWQSLYFSLAAGLAFLALIPFSDSLFALGGHEKQFQVLEAAYFRCLCFSALPTLVLASVGSFFTGRGDSRTVMWITTLGLLVNMVLAYCWIFGACGFPQLGIVGAGLATVAGTSFSAILGLALFFRKRFHEEFATLSAWHWDGELFRRLMRFGLPNGLFASLETLSFAAFLWVMGLIGPVELVATSIAWTLNLIVYFPAMGLAQAVSVLVGQHLGENRPNEAERSTWTGFLLVQAFTFTVGLIYLLAPDALAALFRSQDDLVRWQEVSALVPVLLRFVVLYLLFDSANLVFSFALRGAGDTAFVTLVAVALAWPVMVLPTIAAWWFHWGLYAGWAFVSLYTMLLTLVFFWRFRQGRWRSMRVIESPPLPPGVQRSVTGTPTHAR